MSLIARLVGARRLVVVGAVVVVAAALAVMGFRCFRTVSHDNPALGLISHRFRFCQLREITCDANRDGVVDARAAVISHDNRPQSTGFTVTEGWESVDFDGVMNLHYYYEGKGPDRELVLELDLDKDGQFDELLKGEAAELRFQDVSRCPWTLAWRSLLPSVNCILLLHAA